MKARYKVLGVYGDSETFGYRRSDPITGDMRFFLAARYDMLGKAIYLIGDDVGWNFEATSWKELQKRNDLLGEPRVEVKQETPDFKVLNELYDRVGLIVVKVNGVPVEFHLFPIEPLKS